MENDHIEARFLALAVVVRSMKALLAVAVIGAVLQTVVPSLVSMTVVAGVALFAAGFRAVGDVLVLTLPESASEQAHAESVA